MPISRVRWSALAVGLFAAQPARADNKPDTAYAYGVAVGELSMFGVFAANFSGLWSDDGPAFALNFSPAVLAPAAGIAAHFGELDARPALAVHGGTWFGVTGFMIGALIDGRETRWQMKPGAFAWSLGAVGAVAGGFLGATAVETRDAGSVWLVAPPLGFVAGGLVLGGILVIAGGVSGNNSIGQFATGAIIGTALGLGAATYFAYYDQPDPLPRLQASLGSPTLSDGNATIFSIGGPW
ncbi:MAG: hypothetical protein ACKV2T_20570 [Kofleriaceae bacterium]